MNAIYLEQNQIKTYHTDGVTLIRGLFKDWVDVIRAGIKRNMDNPGLYASENLQDGDTGRFFDDYCNWTRIPEFEDVIRNSDAARVAADLMCSKKVQMFHEHILVKEPGTSKPTPWHQDSPYYFVEGQQNVSFWCPVDHVKEASLRCVVGSHLWNKPVLPVRWLSDSDFYPDIEAYMPVPNPDEEGMNIVEWEMEPGDAIAFNYKTLHGARENNSTARRRAFSLRLLGDDARYITRPGKTSPPFPGHNMADNEPLRTDWFPIIYTRES